MNLEKQNVLFFTRTMKLGGTEQVVLQQIEALQPYVNKIVVCSCGGIYTKQLKKMGISHYTIPDITKKDLFTCLKVCSCIRSIVKREHITIIHTEHRMAAFYTALLRLYKKCTFINTSHNTFTNQRGLTVFSFRHANLIACGGQVKNNLMEYFKIPEKRISVIHNSVRPFSGEVKADAELLRLHQQGYFLIGNIGRLTEQKGMEYFIDSVPEIAAKYPKTRFFIVGSGELDAELKQRVERLGINDTVSFLGYRSDIQNLMSQLDLVVLSSLWEGFPLTPIEAFSVGKTVVGTGVDGTVEIIKNEENGLIVEPRSSKQIAMAVSRMIEDQDLRKNCEIKAAEDYREQFSFEQFKENYVKYYESIDTD